MQDNVTMESESPVEGSVWRLQGIFFEPSRTFTAINRKPTFLLPILLGILISLAASAVIYSKVDMAQVMETAIRNSSAGQQLTSQQIREQVETVTNNPFYKVMLWVSPLLSTPVIVFALSGILMLVIFISGSESTFAKLLGVVSHTMFLYGVIGGGLLVLVLFLAADPQDVDLQNPLYTNLGHLVDAKESPVLNRLLSSVDIITLYVLYLLGLGLSKIAAKMPLSRGIVLAAVPWLIWVGLAVLWKAVIG